MSKSILLLALMVISSLSVSAQNIVRKTKKAPGIEVRYQSSYKGKTYPGEVMVRVSRDGLVSIENGNKRNNLIEKTFMNYTKSESYSWALLPSGKVVSSVNPYTLGKGFTEVREDSFLGLKCKVVRTSINSNTIEVWYTEDIPFRATPQPFVGVPDGLVVRVIRNGDSIQEAATITPISDLGALAPESWGESMDRYDYQYAINHCHDIDVRVFDQETIAFTGAKLPEKLEGGVTYSAGGGTIILKKVSLPENASGKQIFAEVVQYSEGDAYDRTGSVFVIPTDREMSFLDAMRNLTATPSFSCEGVDYHALVSTEKYSAPLELMRFFTGFGVRKFNHNKVRGQHWVDSVNYKTEITHMAEHLTGDVWIGAYIGNWDANGHRVSLKLTYHPEGEEQQRHALPLFNTVNYMEQAGQPYPIFMLHQPLTVTFSLKEEAKNAKLVYTTTGHGGWGGGDEFNQKPNTILLDGKEVITFIPWRDDCGTYRNLSPCSGNFSNGVSSSDLSRSNWCPGMVTFPDYIPLGDLTAGEHTITVSIPQGAPAGSSNSYWCISGTLVY